MPSTLAVGRKRSRSVPLRAKAALGAVALSLGSVFAAWTFAGGNGGETGVSLEAASELTAFSSSGTTATPSVIGYSLQERPIVAYTLGSGARTVLVVGGLHAGAEVETVTTVEHLMAQAKSGSIHSDLTLVFVPAANPDALELGERVNARGVDLNRNWPTSDWAPLAEHSGEEVFAGTAPLSEPETRALLDLAILLQPEFTLSYHGFAGIVDDNGAGNAADLARVYADAANYDHIEDWDDYEITGDMISLFADLSLPAADIELIEGDRQALQRNARAFRALLDAVSGEESPAS